MIRPGPVRTGIAGAVTVATLFGALIPITPDAVVFSMGSTRIVPTGNWPERRSKT
jgi:hypothetical protein